MNELRVTYGWVKDTRKGLLDYCSELSPAVFVQEDSAVGHGSIRNLLGRPWWGGPLGVQPRA